VSLRRRIAVTCLGGLVWSLCQAPGPVLAQEPFQKSVRVGISAERDSDDFRDQVRSLEAFFAQMDGGQFQLVPMPPDALLQAIRNRQLDAAFVNPYLAAWTLQLDQRARALATFEAQMPQGRVGGVGGVILVRGAATGLTSLEDLRGRRVAIPGRLVFGGYVAPLHELQRVSASLRASLQLVEAGSQRGAVESLLRGDSDAAFIDTVVLEQMLAEGALEPGRVRVINRQPLSAYPIATSTRLYPGWALVALPSLTGDELNTLAELLLEVRRRPVRGLHGNLVLAPSYEPVQRVLRELGLPPYAETTSLTWRDIWRQEPLTLALWAGVTLIALILATGVLLYARRVRGLFQQEKLNSRRERALRDMPADVDPHCLTPFIREQLEVMRDLTRSRFVGLYHLNLDRQQVEIHVLPPEAATAEGSSAPETVPLQPGSELTAALGSQRGCILRCDEGSGQRLPGTSRPLRQMLAVPLGSAEEALLVVAVDKEQGYDEQDMKSVELLSAQLWRTLRRSEAEAHLAARDREARASAELLQGIFDSFSGGIIVYGASGGIQLINPMAAGLFGINARDVIGHDLREYGWFFCDAEGRLLHDEEDPVSRVCRDQVPITNLSLGIARDSEHPVAWLLANVRPLLDPSGGITRVVLSFADITSVKQAEDELRLAAEVFETATEGIIISDAEGHIINVNRAFTEITGYAADEVRGRKPDILRSNAHTPDFYERLWDQLRRDGTWRGERTSRRKDGSLYHEMLSINAITDARGQVARYIGVFSDISLLKQQQAELEHQAYYDALTGIPNRILGIESLKLAMTQCERRGRLVAVAYIDLDNFKEVNDGHGHEVGDRLLKVLATRMHVALREGDTLARIGGDEFVAVLCDLQRETDCLPVVERLLALSTEPVTIDGSVLSPTASIGISFYPQGDVELDAEQLLRQADHAMYQAKTEGRNCFRLFDQASNQLLEDKHHLVNDVRRGIAAGEFRLFYQPKVDLHTGEVRGAEALIRWQHPEEGLLAPNRFLLPLENHSVLIELGDWVIDRALDDLQSLHATQPDLCVSVNISPPQLLVEGFADSIRERLEARPEIDGRQLELEILETSALENTRDVAEVISRCAEFGVLFALDDFGSGYSSLVYLQALPIDTLKIDQTFVRNMTSESTDLAILRAIVTLARALKINVVAEGAETEEHCRLLRALGCEVAQGYAFARPMPLQELEVWLAAWDPADSPVARPANPG
jgi:diguanylate cyclase (GGDEF)-like protein/PAS domain S-box-containing protein